jgi:hypothetical protein
MQFSTKKKDDEMPAKPKGGREDYFQKMSMNRNNLF